MTNLFSSNPRRYLALFLPFLPTDRQQRRKTATPSQGEKPLVMVEKVANTRRIMAADRQALALGLTPGLALADALARVPDMTVLDLDTAGDAALLARMAESCDRYTPLVAMDTPDGLVLDISGCTHLFGGEEPLRQDIVNRFARAGFETRCAIAPTPQTARALARYTTCISLVSGEERRVLARLPVQALELAPSITQALVRVGLKTIGDLASRPSAPLSARFGGDVVIRLARLLGDEDIGITPRRALPPCIVERRFAEPVARVEDALAALASLSQRVQRMLEQRGEGGRRFEATFFRTDNKTMSLVVETGRPVRDPDIIMRLIRERIAALDDPLDPGFGYDMIRLSVLVCEPFAQRQDSLDSHAQDDDNTEALTDRLTARFGKSAVVRFVPMGSHVPERAVRRVPASSNLAEIAWAEPDPGLPPSRPLYLFNPPQPIETLAEIPDGPPLRFRWRRVLHEIGRAEGPERIAPEWWLRSEEQRTRDYYRIEDARGARFWVFREGLYGQDTALPRWFMHGIFA